MISDGVDRGLRGEAKVGDAGITVMPPFALMVALRCGHDAITASLGALLCSSGAYGRCFSNNCGLKVIVN